MASNSSTVALVTGASSGIGESLARCFAQDGHDLVLVARSADKLKALAATLSAELGVKAWVEPADLAQPDAAQRLAATLRRKRRRVDVLVNNAGVLEQGAFASMPRGQPCPDDPAQCGRPDRLAGRTAATHGGARIGPGAQCRVDCGLPADARRWPPMRPPRPYVLSLTESLSEELRGTGVTLTALCPGITATGMLSKARERQCAAQRSYPTFLIGDVDDVARQGFRACMRGDTICVPGVVNQAAMLASRSTPKWLVRRLGGLMARQAL
jgi:short-subunit dehydrogenase